MSDAVAVERLLMPVAVHVFVVRDGRILLLRRANTGYEDGNYSVPAGHLERGETVMDAAAREAREEAGIEIDVPVAYVVGAMHRRVESRERIDFFVEATVWAGEISNREPHKCDDLTWSAMSAMPENVVPYVRRAIENYRAGEWFASFGWEEEAYAAR
jgi:ADP-ribose pyrophosphatase YjhB (NUDIX family)